MQLCTDSLLTRFALHGAQAEIGKAHNKSAAQVAIAFQVNRGVPTFPKSVTESRIKQNLDVLIKFSVAEMAQIGALNKDNRVGWGGAYCRGTRTDSSCSANHVLLCVHAFGSRSLTALNPNGTTGHMGTLSPS